MRLVIIGATGRTGRQVTLLALRRGHEVTAVVRKPTLQNAKNLHIVVADPCNPEELEAAFTGQDAVISCLGQRSGGNPWLVRDATRAALDAMRQAELKRLVIVSGALLYPSYNPLVLILQRMMVLKLTDARAAEAAVSVSCADWTVVRPPHLKKGPGKGYRADPSRRPRMAFGLHFEDLAACLLDIAEAGTYLRQVVGVSAS